MVCVERSHKRYVPLHTLVLADLQAMSLLRYTRYAELARLVGGPLVACMRRKLFCLVELDL
jgi:hypothetical protein